MEGRTLVNLDFDARVPIPFSIFPSTYRNDVAANAGRTRVEAEVTRERVGREDRYSSFQVKLPKEDRPRRREEVRVYEERDRDSVTELDISRDRYQEPIRKETTIDIDIERRPRRESESEIDITERDYRTRFQPAFQPTYDVEHERRAPASRESIHIEAKQPTYEIEYERRAPPREHVHIEAESTVEAAEKSKMGYYDDHGHYHSFRRGLERAADRIVHPISGGGSHHHHSDREELVVERHGAAPRSSVRVIERGGSPNTVTIPCHHIRIGDLLVLQGRPCQVIRITTSAQTGQHRYLGVDLFTKQLHEESSFVSNPEPSVVVQTMLGPVFKEYRVLDIARDGRVVAMTETGDVRQGIPIIDQGSLFDRLNDAFADGRGSVRVLVINDGGRELGVDYKVIHGSRL